METERRWRVWPAVVAILFVTASCSITDGLLESEVEDTVDMDAAAETAAEVETGPDPIDQQEAVEGQTESPPPSIWARGNDAAMRPTSPLATVSELIAPGNGMGWIAVGSIFDYSTGNSQPVVWSADEPSDGDSWMRVELQQPEDGDAQITGAARAEELDVAVGSYGEERSLRPAVWVRSAGGQWRSIDRSQFDRGSPEWLSHVAVNQSNGLLLAVGAQRDARNDSRPIVWLSADGQAWDPVEDLPFSADGSQSFRGLAVGSTTSVLTGQQSGSTRTAIAFWSEDGRTWTKAEVETPADGGRSYMGESTWFNDRFVAVGAVATGDVFRPASWTSNDGKVWELQQIPFPTIGERTVNVGFGALHLTSTESMLYAAADASFVQQLWQSSDGVNWTLLGDISDVRADGMSVNSIVAVDDQVLLATGRPGVVIYQDGYEKAPLQSELLPVPDEIPWVSDIGYVDGGWVAVGGSSVPLRSGGTNELARLWRSADGINWELGERLPETSTGAVAAVAPLADGLVAVGAESVRSATAQRRHGRGLIWRFTASGWDELDAESASEDGVRIGLQEVASAGNDLLAGGWRFVPTGSDSDALLIQGNEDGEPELIDIGHQGPDNELLVALCGNQTGEAVTVVSSQQPDNNQLSALRRNPEREWADAEWPLPSEDERAMVADCAYGVDGFLAAGFTKTGGFAADVGLWRSADGSVWERVDGPPSFSGPADQYVDSMVATEDGYLLAGNDASTGQVKPIVWYGSGDDWQRVTIRHAATMESLQIGYANGTIVVAGWNDGATQVYSTTLEQLIGVMD